MSGDFSQDFGSSYTTITLASSFALFSAYYILSVAQRPKLYSGCQILKGFLENHVPSIHEKYFPGPFLLGWLSWEGRLQSALGLHLRLLRDVTPPYEREILDLRDGGQLALDTLYPSHENEKIEERLVVLLLPGLTSCSKTSYVKTLAMSVQDGGATVVIMNNRGLGGVDLKTPRTYCAANHEDIQEVIDHLGKKYRNYPIMALGCSLGGIMLSRYIINHPEEAKKAFRLAMVLSICWDPMVGTASLEKPFINKYIVNKTMTQNLQYLARRNREVLEVRECWDMQKVMNSKTLREFDHHFTAPQFGFGSYEEYYKAATISQHIHKFSIPVIGLNSIDDPMQPGEFLPIEEASEEDSKLALLVTSRGGHLGFLEGILPTPKPVHYMERVVKDVVKAARLYSHELPQ